MSDPVNSGLYAFQSQMWLLNTTSGSQAVIDRVQSVEPSVALTTQRYYELGRKGPIGATQNPAQWRLALMQNLYNSLELDYILSGKNISPAGVQTWNLGDLLTNAGRYTAYVLNRNQDATIMDEKEVNGCSIADITWSFNVNSAITQAFNLIGTGGKLYKSASTVHTWGATDDTSLGGVHGKEARVWFTSGSVATTRAFRIQSMQLRATYPNIYIGELGRRALVGTLSDAPEVSLDFDILLADDQPTDKFFVDQTTYYDLNSPTSPFNAYIRIDDPTNTSEGVSIIKSFLVENVVSVAHTPIRSQVRGLSTARYSLIVSKETTANSGGVTISNSNQ